MSPPRSQLPDLTADLPANIHGCAIAVDGRGILIIGPARSGKSSLCLSTLRRAASLALPAKLVADDRVIVTSGPYGLELSAHERLFGLIEVSGVGILHEEAVSKAPLSVLVELRPEDEIARLPETATSTVFDHTIRRIRLPVRQSAFSADVLVSLALGSFAEGVGEN